MKNHLEEQRSISKWKSYGLLDTDGGSSSFSFQQKKPIKKSNTMQNLSKRIKTTGSLSNSQSESNSKFQQRKSTISQRSSLNKQPLDDDIHFDMFSLNVGSNIISLEQGNLPLVIQLRTKTLEELNQVGVDLFCLIDISNSMHSRIDSVKLVLEMILSNLGEQDRLCLISFNNEGKLLTGLQKVTAETQEYFQYVIEDLVCSGTTQIWKATDIAFDVINQRKNQNNWVRIFIFSDGQDEIAITKIKKQLEYNYDVFTIDGFGFEEHNQKLQTIANLRFGQYYLITHQSNKSLEQCFLNYPFNYWDEIKITIQCNQINQPFSNILISQIHSQGWIEIEQQQKYEITIPNLQIGDSFMFPIELSLKNFKGLSDNNNNNNNLQTLLKGKIIAKNKFLGKEIVKNIDLDVLFIHENNSNKLDFNTYYNCKQSPIIIWICENNSIQFNRTSYFELLCENLQLKWELQQQKIKSLYEDTIN